MSTDRQLIQNAQENILYGRFLDIGAAFNKGLLMATKGGNTPTINPVGAVKNNYENQLETYLNTLPAGVDLASIPDTYKNNIQNFLFSKKQEYVNLANQINEYEVGSETYLQMKDDMNNIRSSFVNLSNQMKGYGEQKKLLIEDIQKQVPSLYADNQANVNLLRGVFNEEYAMVIDDFGNVGFEGDDITTMLNDLPQYTNKDYTIAGAMLKQAEAVYKNGTVLKKGGFMYNKFKNDLVLGIDQGGTNRLMSIIHDGLIGDVKMIDDPYIEQQVDLYKNGQLSFQGLRDLVVDNYMNVLVETSRTGYRVKKGPGAASGGSRSDISGLSTQQIQLVKDMRSAKNDDGSRKYTEIEIGVILQKMKAGEDVRYTGDMTKVDFLSSPEYKTDTKDPYSGDIEEINPYAKYKVK